MAVKGNRVRVSILLLLGVYPVKIGKSEYTVYYSNGAGEPKFRASLIGGSGLYLPYLETRTDRSSNPQLRARKALADIVVQCIDNGEMVSTKLSRDIWERSSVRGPWEADFAPLWQLAKICGGSIWMRVHHGGTHGSPIAGRCWEIRRSLRFQLSGDSGDMQYMWR